MKKYQYQVIRYVHDHFTGEYVNVGVILYSPEAKFLACKITVRYQRVTNMFPEANGKWISQILQNIRQQVNSVSQQFNELFTPSDSLEMITGVILPADNGAIQLTEIRQGIDVDMKAALTDLFKSQVEKYLINKVDKESLLDEDVWRTKYKIYFEKYGIEKRLRVHDVKVPKDVISFQKSWKNEIWHCYEPLSFYLKEKDSIKAKVYKWAGQLKGLAQAEEQLHLTLLTSISPRHKDLAPFIDEYLKVSSKNLKVDIITDDKAESLAKQIHLQMKSHDAHK
jgi:hypothetical protein